ncbi:universal stress protein [Alicyclobacillus fodiniaquatilis]|uniref:Universal stress protein n=1 Tax=Alicyclobacillus fodiniaquatilis TaxID=1661150 RepID=A0ABW4JFY3_9BACL
MKKILLCVNHSRLSENASRVTRDLLSAYPQAEVVAIYVTEFVTSRFGHGPLLGMEYEKELASKIRRKIEKEFFKDVSNRVHFEHRTGTAPAKVICQAAMDHDCDLIVVGNPSKTILRELVSGSVSRSVAAHAKVPVLLARNKPVSYL